MKPRVLATGMLLAPWILPLPQATAQKVEYPAEEFSARRQALCSSLGNQGFVLMFGKTVVPAGVRFRQDNDFYYFTGNEDLNAIMFMDAASCDATLFLPAQTEREASRDGWNMLYQEGAAEANGYAAVHPLTYLQEFLSRNRNGRPADPLRPTLGELRRWTSPEATWPSSPPAGWPTPSVRFRRKTPGGYETLRERFPYYDLKDITPHIDPLRMIKSPREIEALKRNGWVSAEAHIRGHRSDASRGMGIRDRGRGNPHHASTRGRGCRVSGHRRSGPQQQRLALPGQRTAAAGR